MRIVLLATACALAGCSMDKAIELSLRMPTGDAAAVDLGCVRSVEVIVGGHGFDDITFDSIDLDSPPSSFADIERAIGGEFVFDLPPSGLQFVEIRATTANDGLGDAIIYGGAHYEVDADEMVLPVAVNLDCANRMSQPLAVKTTDFMALVSTPSGMPPQCTAYPGAVGVDFGTMRPTLMPMPCLGTWFDFGGVTTPLTDGVAQISNAFTRAEGMSCLAVGERVSNTISCVYPGNQGICSTTELEVGLLDFEASSASVDFALADEMPGVVFGTVWNGATRTPIAGATIEILDGGRGEVVYTSLSGIQFIADPTATSTRDRGLFMLYLAEPVRIRIAAPGKPAKELAIAGMAPSTIIATM